MTVSRLWILAVSILVPRDERETWRQEWVAELEATGKGMPHASGALCDAWYLRTEGWTMEGMLRDIRMAVKSMVRNPFFTALAGITLAIGIGANTAIYSVVDGVLINPLPYPESQDIVSVNHTAPGLNLPIVPQSEGTYLFYHEGFHTLAAFAVFADGTVNLIDGGDPMRLSSAQVTREFFDVMGVHPALGRGIAAGEDRKGAEPIAILSHGLWQRAFGGDRSIVGRVVEMDGVRRRIVGVMPAGFDFPVGTDVWLPFSIDDAQPDVASFGAVGIGRLAKGMTPAEVNAEMQELMFRYADAHPDELSREMLQEAGMAPDVKPLKELFVADVAQALWILLGTVGFVLLIACANVANLFLVRAEARQREQAVRTALGATRADMTRQYLTESVALGAGSGVLGLGLAYFGVKALLAIAPVALPFPGAIGIDGSVLAFTVAISAGSGVLFGLFPVFGYARRNLLGALKEGGRASTTGGKRLRARSFLVVTQVALALVLLVGAGLMARTFLKLRSLDPGFDTRNRLAFRYSLPAAEYPDVESVVVFHRELQEKLGEIPGVRAAALITALPLEPSKKASPMERTDRPVPEGTLGPLVHARMVSPGYFAAMGISLLEGREMTWHDGIDSRFIIVSQTLARDFWPDGSSVLGRRIRFQGDEESWRIIGVAEDVRFESLARDPAPLAYFPLAGDETGAASPARSVNAVMRVGSDPLSFVAAARNALREVGPRIPMVEPTTVDRIYRDAMGATSFTVLLLGIASGIALVLGTVGIYGVISYTVNRRTQEIGVRIALGAQATAVLRRIVGQGMLLTGIGIAIGLLGALAVSRVLSALLFGVATTDPLTYVGMTCGLAVVALLASWLPARRAARIDPVETLRSE